MGAVAKVMFETTFVLGHNPLHFCEVEAADLAISHLFIEARERFACPRKEDKPAHRLIESVDGMEKYRSRLLILFFDPCLQLRFQIGRIAAVGLRQKACRLIRHEEVVIDEENVV